MKSKGLVIVVIAALIILGSMLSIIPVKASGYVELYDPNGNLVPPTYVDIQPAVSNAQPGYEVRVYGGTYYEHVYITTNSITIMEAAGNTAILDGLPSGGPQLLVGFEINGASNVLIDGFTIQRYWLAGVWVHKDWGTGTPASGNSVENCEIQDNSGHGILVGDSSYNKFEKNIVHDNSGIGIFVDAGGYTQILKNDIYLNGWGVALHIGALSTVKQNTITDNMLGDGINADGYSYNLLIEKNDILRNGRMGIYVISGGNTITKNTVADNAADGIRLEQGGGNFIEKNEVMTNGNYGIVTGTLYFWLATGMDVPSSYNTIKQNVVSGSVSGYDLVEDIHAILNSWIGNSGIFWTTHLA